MITHKPDPANDGPEVDIIRYFRAFPEGSMWVYDNIGNPMSLFMQIIAQMRRDDDIRTAKSSRKKRSRTSNRPRS